eukprot:NODE_142_length_17801_cov_0.377020.p9 type:complete len:140 gc:universal NODE_142_length_17801_cov_0.377020:10186-10605(+)
MHISRWSFSKSSNLALDAIKASYFNFTSCNCSSFCMSRVLSFAVLDSWSLFNKSVFSFNLVLRSSFRSDNSLISVCLWFNSSRCCLQMLPLLTSCCCNCRICNSYFLVSLLLLILDVILFNSVFNMAFELFNMAMVFSR